MKNQYIDDDKSLEVLCEELIKAPLLAIDTEFVRTRTYYPRLGLLQVSDGNTIALIDPVVINDLSPFWRLIESPTIKKVLHACSEDLEVFMTHGNCRPVNLIDSQIMMSFLGHGLSLGYAAMVQHYLDITLDKSDSRTDWIKRPLTDSQLSYASADVEHLFQLFPTLDKELKQSPWYDAAVQETELMIEKKYSSIDEGILYRQVKMSWRLNSKQLNNLKFLTKWRYQLAKQKDQPISFIAKDHTLMGLAQYAPKSVSAMASIEGIDVLDVRYKGKAMLTVLKQAEQADESDYPKVIRRLDEYPGYKQTFKKIKTFISKIANEHEQQVENFASKKQINQFLTWHYKLDDEIIALEKIEILSTWRKALFGEQLLEHAKLNFSKI